MNVYFSITPNTLMVWSYWYLWQSPLHPTSEYELKNDFYDLMECCCYCTPGHSSGTAVIVFVAVGTVVHCTCVCVCGELNNHFFYSLRCMLNCMVKLIALCHKFTRLSYSKGQTRSCPLVQCTVHTLAHRLLYC